MSYKNKKILAIVPARAGSKTVIRKNLKKIGRFSLIARAAKICDELDWLDEAIISTDDSEMQQEGVKFNLNAPFIRPTELASDEASAIDVWTHAFIETEKYYKTFFDISILLEPSSPFRKVEHVTKTVKKLIEGNFDSVFTVSKTDSKSHPFKQFIFNGDSIMFYDNRGENIVARQQLDEIYHRNGIAYAATRECLLQQKAIIGKKSSAICINETVVNIDTQFDLKFARFLFSSQ